MQLPEAERLPDGQHGGFGLPPLEPRCVRDRGYIAAHRAAVASWMQEIREQQAAKLREELRRRLQFAPAGQRIHVLRLVLGWTQRRAAEELRISRRTVIRYEQGHNRRRWLRLQALERLRALEAEYADELLAYLTRGGREQA